MRNILIIALVAAILVLVTKIVYDVRKLVMSKKRIYTVRVSSVEAEAYFFVTTKKEANQIALDWRDKTGVLNVETSWMTEEDAQLFQEILTEGFKFEKHVGANGAEMYVANMPAPKTPD